jgi:hypothetical protein
MNSSTILLIYSRECPTYILYLPVKFGCYWWCAFQSFYFALGWCCLPRLYCHFLSRHLPLIRHYGFSLNCNVYVDIWDLNDVGCVNIIKKYDLCYQTLNSSRYHATAFLRNCSMKKLLVSGHDKYTKKKKLERP